MTLTARALSNDIGIKFAKEENMRSFICITTLVALWLVHSGHCWADKDVFRLPKQNSADGHYVVEPTWPGTSKGPRDSLDPEDLKRDALYVFAKGKLAYVFQVKDFVDRLDELPRSASHFKWLKTSKLDEVKLIYRAVTYDGNVIEVDLSTGKFTKKRAGRAPDEPKKAAVWRHGNSALVS